MFVFALCEEFRKGKHSCQPCLTVSLQCLRIPPEMSCQGYEYPRNRIPRYNIMFLGYLLKLHTSISEFRHNIIIIIPVCMTIMFIDLTGSIKSSGPIIALVKAPLARLPSNRIMFGDCSCTPTKAFLPLIFFFTCHFGHACRGFAIPVT